MHNSAAIAYGDVHRASLVEGASPHTLVKLLMTNALSRIVQAKQHQKNQEWAELHRCIDKAIAIVQELQGSLKDTENDDLSSSLFSLYSYIIDQLMLADRRQGDESLESASQILITLLDAWQQIEPGGIHGV